MRQVNLKEKIIMRTKIKKWDDGDSGLLTTGQRFRLAGVRAPEKGKRGGSTATRRAAGMTGTTQGVVNVSIVGRDKYGRQLVNMSNKDGSINQRLRKKGYTNKGR
jgi:micrococcal nuclease